MELKRRVQLQTERILFCIFCGDRSAAKLLSKDEARRIASNMAKLSALSRQTKEASLRLSGQDEWGNPTKTPLTSSAPQVAHSNL
jgi:hypothetical protein